MSTDTEMIEDCRIFLEKASAKYGEDYNHHQCHNLRPSITVARFKTITEQLLANSWQMPDWHSLGKYFYSNHYVVRIFKPCSNNLLGNKEIHGNCQVSTRAKGQHQIFDFLQQQWSLQGISSPCHKSSLQNIFLEGMCITRNLSSRAFSLPHISHVPK